MDAAQGKTALPHLQGASELGFCGRQPPLNLIPLLLRRRHSFLALCRARCRSWRSAASAASCSS
jgi:hypothetical protein